VRPGLRRSEGRVLHVRIEEVGSSILLSSTEVDLRKWTFSNRAALLVRSATAWREHLGELVDVQGVMRVLGVSTRQARLSAKGGSTASEVIPAYTARWTPFCPHPGAIEGELSTQS